MGVGRRPDPPDHHRRGVALGRGLAALQPDRHRVGGSHVAGGGNRPAEGPLPDGSRGGHRRLVPAVLRARGRLGPGSAGHPGGARRRRVDRQRPEDLDLARPPGPLRHPDRQDRSRRAQAPRHLVLHLSDGRTRDRDPPDHRDDRRAHVQRGLPDRRPHPGGEPGRRGERRLAAGQGHAVQRAGLVVLGRRVVGSGSDRRGPARRGAGRRGRRPTPPCAGAWWICTSNRRSCA